MGLPEDDQEVGAVLARREADQLVWAVSGHGREGVPALGNIQREVPLGTLVVLHVGCVHLGVHGAICLMAYSGDVLNACPLYVFIRARCIGHAPSKRGIADMLRSPDSQSPPRAGTRKSSPPSSMTSPRARSSGRE